MSTDLRQISSFVGPELKGLIWAYTDIAKGIHVLMAMRR